MLDREESGTNLVLENPGQRNYLRVGLKPLPTGTYKVHWRAVSADTHAIEGNFSFHVGKQ